MSEKWSILRKPPRGYGYMQTMIYTEGGTAGGTIVSFDTFEEAMQKAKDLQEEGDVVPLYVWCMETDAMIPVQEKSYDEIQKEIARLQLELQSTLVIPSEMLPKDPPHTSSAENAVYVANHHLQQMAAAALKRRTQIVGDEDGNPVGRDHSDIEETEDEAKNGSVQEVQEDVHSDEREQSSVLLRPGVREEEGMGEEAGNPSEEVEERKSEEEAEEACSEEDPISEEVDND